LVFGVARQKRIMHGIAPCGGEVAGKAIIREMLGVGVRRVGGAPGLVQIVKPHLR